MHICVAAITRAVQQTYVFVIIIIIYVAGACTTQSCCHEVNDRRKWGIPNTCPRRHVKGTDFVFFGVLTNCSREGTNRISFVLMEERWIAVLTLTLQVQFNRLPPYFFRNKRCSTTSPGTIPLFYRLTLKVRKPGKLLSLFCFTCQTRTTVWWCKQQINLVFVLVILCNICGRIVADLPETFCRANFFLQASFCPKYKVVKFPRLQACTVYRNSWVLNRQLILLIFQLFTAFLFFA